MAGRGWILKTPGSAPFPFLKGAADSGRRCFADRRGRASNPPFARGPGRFRPDVWQFVAAERTGSDRRLERRRNPLLRGERLNTAMRICLREPSRKPETEPSVSATLGAAIVLPALRLRTCPGSPLRSDNK